MIPLAESIKRYFSLKEFVIVVLAIVISATAGVGVFLSLKKEVVIDDDGKQIVVKTMKTTVKEVLEQNGIKVKPEDYISLPLETKLQKIRKNELYIKRAVPISVLVDGQDIKLMTYRNTVKDALANSPVKVTSTDRLEGVNAFDKVVKDMKIKVVRVKEEVVSEKTSIPYRVTKRGSDRLDQGTEKVLKEGKQGIREKLFKIVLEDGKEVARELIKDMVVSNPIDKIVEYGTVSNYKTARGDTIRYKKVLNMKATAYTASYADTGKRPGDPGFGITYTGMRARKGVIAVDPRVIPLGTRMYIEVAGDAPDYGYAIAGDIGGAIKGNLIDLYFDSSETVKNWGRRRVKVYILRD
ncbi:MAG: 3D domain-containing protein [Clostridia bacterium]|nr:3D domain-containing protein [Clostridia bacterium]